MEKKRRGLQESECGVMQSCIRTVAFIARLKLAWGDA